MLDDFQKYISEPLLSSTFFCDNFLKLRDIFVRLLYKSFACQKFIRQEFAQC